MSYRAFWQRRCRAAAAEAVLKPLGGNCAVLPKEKQYHLKRQILPDIAAYETLQRVMPKEEALQTVHGYVERLARTSHKQLAALLHILHTQNPACVCEISVIFFVFRYTLGLPQAPGLAGGLTMYKQAEAEQNNAKPRDCG